MMDHSFYRRGDGLFEDVEAEGDGGIGIALAPGGCAISRRMSSITLAILLCWCLLHGYLFVGHRAVGVSHEDAWADGAQGVRKVRVKATAYSNDVLSIDVPEWFDGLTATGEQARRGLVAADWGVFPPGTRLYIPGYGEAVVEDRGGGIRGAHIDLFMDSRAEAVEWGVREIEVFVIEGGPVAVSALPGLPRTSRAG